MQSLLNGNGALSARRSRRRRATRKVKLAFFAADLHRGPRPTVKELVKYLGVSKAYIYAAEKASEDFAKRMSILAGEQSLVPEGKRKSTAEEPITERFARLSDAECIDFARAIGPQVLWDKLINPLL
jgi:hypothetical protein